MSIELAANWSILIDIKVSLSFEKSLYLETMGKKVFAPMTTEEEENFDAAMNMTDEEFEAFLLDDSEPTPEEQEEAKARDAEIQKVKDFNKNKLFTRNLKQLRLEKGEADTYPMYGISPDLIKGSKEAIEEDTRDSDEMRNHGPPFSTQHEPQRLCCVTKKHHFDPFLDK